MSFVDSSEYGFLIKTEDLVLPDSEGANVTSVNSSLLYEGLDGNFSNKKILVYLEVTEVCAGDGALDLKVQASLDGVTFVDVDASTVADVDPTDLNKAVALADLTNIYAPYYRLVVFSDGTDILDDAGVRIKIAIPGY